MSETLDPRLNCAAGICCGPSSDDARVAAMQLLHENGVPADCCEQVAVNLHNAGIVLLPAKLARIIKQIALPEERA